MLNNFKKFLNKNSQKILWLFIFLYTFFFILICFWKYNNFLYNGIDLAIFNQVFFNTSEYRFFEFSVHPHSYLGDHFIPFILLLTPIYILFKGPLILLFLQSLILGLSAWPVYLITKEVFKSQNSNFVSIILSTVFLLNPLLWNTNLFEFHILPFALFFLLFAFYFFLKRKFLLYALFLILALTIREDISLIIFMFSFLPFLDYKKERPYKLIYFLFPFLISIFYFFSSNIIINHFNPDGAYKFLAYYQWLGESNSLFELIINILSQPLKVFLHFFSPRNLIVVFVFLLPFVFLPIFSKRYLLLALGPFIQFFLSSSGSEELLYKTHYAILFLLALTVSSIYGLKNFLKRKNCHREEKQTVLKILIQDKFFLIIFVGVTIIYANFVIGPTLSGSKEIYNYTKIKDRTIVIKTLIDKIPSDASIVSSFDFLPNLSNRQDLYSLHYGFLGKTQFSKDDYKFPEEVDYYLIDFSDLIIYQIQYNGQEKYFSGNNRLQEYLKNYGVVEVADTIVLFKKNYKSDIKLIETNTLLDHIQNKKIEQKFGQSYIINYSFIWQIFEKI